jgi:hypothetical protein
MPSTGNYPESDKYNSHQHIIRLIHFNIVTRRYNCRTPAIPPTPLSLLHCLRADDVTTERSHMRVIARTYQKPFFAPNGIKTVYI